MRLNQIEIKNFKSVEHVVLDLKKIGNNYTYCLFGINESGKSSILRAISLFDEEGLSYPEDYFDETKNVEIIFHYSIDESVIKALREQLVKENKCPKEISKKIIATEVKINVVHSNDTETEREIIEHISFKTEIFQGFTNDDSTIIKKGKDSTEDDLNITTFLRKYHSSFFYGYSHAVVFWESTSKYLILDEISLTEFSTNPSSASIPLLNCFKLAGIRATKDIAKAIASLTSHARIRNLESLLSRKVTEHINTIWENHPISILFEIDSDKISLLIEDTDVHYKAKTTSQRSDGFKQFISFLLTISADDKTESLNSKILLIDEPETHLHPQAQLNLIKELNKITSNQNSTIVLYATHSNYLIDKSNLNRNFKVFKEKNEKTKVEKIQRTSSSYSEVNFEVFEIPTTDYHNELYGYLEEIDSAKLQGLDQDRQWIDSRNNATHKVSLPKYIRHSIHHPENTLNRKFTEAQLKKSINILRKLKYD
ncbi:ATP-dependent nuclease [Flagellimonas sp.]|uniref:ATP-dependent nuclease n=1 Tax=Flagellimonas sp. TaxID=2058762 RepID=UPI003B51DA0D